MPFFHELGDWPAGAVLVRWVDSTQRLEPEALELVERAWQQASARPGVHLFDGPMCRLERIEAGPALRIFLSRTSYRVFLGTNMCHPELADEYGPQALANPIGLSCALVSAEGHLLLGRRNGAVAYYPERIHPFAGALEPADPLDVFAEVRRELREELSLMADDLGELRCLGRVEDPSLRQPELVFLAPCRRMRDQVLSQLATVEHAGALAIAQHPPALQAAAGDCRLTPVARATVLLWGRRLFGSEWFEKMRVSLPR